MEVTQHEIMLWRVKLGHLRLFSGFVRARSLNRQSTLFYDRLYCTLPRYGVGRPLLHRVGHHLPRRGGLPVQRLRPLQDPDPMRAPCAPGLAPSDSRSHASHTRAAGTRCSAASARSSLASCPPPMECRRVWASSSRSLSPQPSRLRSPTSLALVRLAPDRGPAQSPPLRPHPRLPAAGGAVPTYSPTSGEIGTGIWGIKASVMSYCKTPDQKVDAKAEARVTEAA